jgi:hypothetical protein
LNRINNPKIVNDIPEKANRNLELPYIHLIAKNLSRANIEINISITPATMGINPNKRPVLSKGISQIYYFSYAWSNTYIVTSDTNRGGADSFAMRDISTFLFGILAA